MSNNRDFIVKNAVEVGGATKVTVGDAATGGSYTAGPDLSVAAYDSVSFSVTSQASGPNGFFIKSDGTKLYVIGQNSDAVFQYTLSTAWDLSTASYDSVSFSVSSQATVPYGVFFKSDGTKMYVVNGSTDSVYQYSLSTAWDLSTASYDSVSFSVFSQATIPRSVDFSSDGLNMYVSNASDDALYQYALSTAWDLSTASYASKTVSVQTQEGTLRGHAFNSNGTKLFIVGTTADTVFQYDLTTAWDISTATYSSTSFSIASQSGTPHDIFFKDDGAKMYILDGAADSLYQYSTGSTVTTGSFDLSTGNYFTDTPSADVEYTFSNAGDVQSFQLEVTGNQSVVGYDITSAAYDSVSLDISTLVSPVGPYSFYMKPDGTRMYFTSSDTDGVEEVELSTAFDLSTATYGGAFSASSQDDDLRGITFKPDGTKMYLTGRLNDRVYEYSLSTAWDVTSASYTDFLSLAGRHTNPTSLMFNNDGTKLYTVGSSASPTVINEWNVSTAYDVSTASYSQQAQIQSLSPTGIAFNDDGTKLFVATTGGDTVYYYTLSTAYDVSTLSYVSGADFYVGTQAAFPTGVQFNSDGTKMYVCDATTKTVYQYTFSSSTAITVTWDADIAWPSGTAPDSPAAGEKDIYTFTTDDGGTTYIGVQSGDAFS